MQVAKSTVFGGQAAITWPVRSHCLSIRSRRGWWFLMPQVGFFCGDFKLFSEVVENRRNIEEVTIPDSFG